MKKRAISRFRQNLKKGGLGGGIQQLCPGFTGQLPSNENETMGTPKVFAFYWDDMFVESPAATLMLDQYISMIVNSLYFDGLAQYGVNRGVFLGSKTISSTQEVPENPMTENDLAGHLSGWLNSGLAPQPDGEHYDSLYVIITPQGVVHEFAGLVSNAPDGMGFDGYHSSRGYNVFEPFAKDNLFYAVIVWSPENPAQFPSWPAAVINGFAPSISHEIVEAATDRSGNGFNITIQSSSESDFCECGDICQTVISVNGWPTNAYYSNADTACIPAVIQQYLVYDATNANFISLGFPAELLATINDGLLSGNGFVTVVFTPSGGTVVLLQNNWVAKNGLSQIELDRFDEFIPLDTLINLACAPNGGWIFIGSNGFWCPPEVSPSITTAIEEFVNANVDPPRHLISVAFAPNGSAIIICDNNELKAISSSDGWDAQEFPEDVFGAVGQFVANGSTLQNVTFFPNYSAIITGTGGDFVQVGQVPMEVWNVLGGLGGMQGGAIFDQNIQIGSSLTSVVVGPIQ